MIYLTSFKRSGELPDHVERFSAAVYQPKGFSYRKAEWTDIRNPEGTWTRPREFVNDPNPALAYRNTLLSIYSSRIFAASTWLSSLEGDAALLCWCPYDRAAVRQLKEWGSFICHTAVLAEFLSVDLKTPVWLDSDRLFMTVLTQKGINDTKE
jgi:hypothetical protein